MRIKLDFDCNIVFQDCFKDEMDWIAKQVHLVYLDGAKRNQSVTRPLLNRDFAVIGMMELEMEEHDLREEHDLVEYFEKSH